MRLVHVALVSSSEQNADRFYGEILGLEKLKVKNLSAGLSKPLFDRNEDFKLIIYGNQDIQFEIFISDRKNFTHQALSHTCLEVADRMDILERCNKAGLEIRRVPKNGSTVVFVKDFDGNLFEIKEG